MTSPLKFTPPGNLWETLLDLSETADEAFRKLSTFAETHDQGLGMHLLAALSMKIKNVLMEFPYDTISVIHPSAGPIVSDKDPRQLELDFGQDQEHDGHPAGVEQQAVLGLEQSQT